MVQMGRGLNTVVAAIGLDGLVERLASSVVGDVQPLAGRHAVEPHRRPDRHALFIDGFQDPGHGWSDPLHVVLELAARAFDARGVQHSDRGVKDRADVVHSGLDGIVPGDELVEGLGQGRDRLRSPVCRNGGNRNAVLDAEDLHLSRVHRAAGVEQCLRLGDDHISRHALLSEDVMDLQRAARAPGVEDDDLAVYQVRRHRLGQPRVTGGRDDDHDDVRALDCLLDVGCGKSDGAHTARYLFPIMRDHLDCPTASHGLQVLWSSVEELHPEPHHTKVAGHRQAAVTGAQHSESPTFFLGFLLHKLLEQIRWLPRRGWTSTPAACP